MRKRHCVNAVCIVILALACTPAPPRVLPPIEPWGDVLQPYGDSLEAAAIAAMRPSSAVASLDSDMLDLQLQTLRTDPTNVAAFEMASLALAERGEYRRAHALACQGVRLAPESARLWGVLSMIYLARGDDARARVALEQVLDLEPDAVPGAAASLAALHVRKGTWQPRIRSRLRCRRRIPPSLASSRRCVHANGATSRLLVESWPRSRHDLTRKPR